MQLKDENGETIRGQENIATRWVYKYFKDLLNVKNERYNDEVEEPDNTDPVV